MGTIRTHNLLDSTVTHDLLDDQGKLLRQTVANEDGHILETRVSAPERRGPTANITLTPREYRVDIFNWNSPKPLIQPWKLANLMENYPDGSVNWPKIAGGLGFKVRAGWNWAGDLKRGRECAMEVFGERLGDVHRFIKNTGGDWVQAR